MPTKLSKTNLLKREVSNRITHIIWTQTPQSNKQKGQAECNQEIEEEKEEQEEEQDEEEEEDKETYQEQPPPQKKTAQKSSKGTKMIKHQQNIKMTKNNKRTNLAKQQTKRKQRKTERASLGFSKRMLANERNKDACFNEKQSKQNHPR